MFRIFISSTFNDLSVERDVLREKTFAKLNHLCQKHGVLFRAVDLRWGVSEEAGYDQKTMKICLEEIRRCQQETPRPNFIVLLGNRYGWQPLPFEIPASLFEQILSQLSATQKGKDYVDQLRAWYVRDDNSIPPQYTLKPREGDYRNQQRWSSVERTLLFILKEGIQNLSLTPDERLLFGASATEQEIAAGTDVPNAEDSVYCFFRNIAGEVPFDLAKEYFDTIDRSIDKNAKDRVHNLKRRLQQMFPANVYEYETQGTQMGILTDYLDVLCNDVYARISKAISEELASRPQLDALQKEQYHHNQFMDARTHIFVGRQNVLKHIEEHIMSGSRSPFAIIGQSGVGKSTLMAKAVQQARHQHLDTVVICRFAGTTPGSSNNRSLLRSLCQELSRSYGASESDIPDDFKGLVKAFRDKLAYASSNKPLIVFIDALDQLSAIGYAEGFPWIPFELPPFARLIVSALPDQQQTLERIIAPENLIVLKPMTNDDGEQLLNAWLTNVHRTLQKDQRQKVMDRFYQYPFPLYLELIFEQARRWPSWESNMSLGKDTPAVITALFENLSSESNHGEVFVSRVLSYLAVAKNGLSEDELLEILGADRDVMIEYKQRFPYSPPVSTLPPIIWSRMYHDLAPYLTTRSADNSLLLTFFHRQFFQSIRKKLLSPQRKRACHRQLADYFTRQPMYLDGADEQVPNLRKLSELPYQLTEAQMWEDLKALLLNFAFLNAKVRALGPQALIDDFEYALAQRQKLHEKNDDYPSSISMVEDAIRLSAHVLSRNPDQLASQLIGHLLSWDVQEIKTLLAEAKQLQHQPWLRPLTENLRDIRDPLRRTLGGHAATVWKVVVSHGGRFAISTGNDGTVVVYDLALGIELYRRTGLPEPVLCVAISPDERFFVCASGSKLLSYDLERGTRLGEINPNIGWIRTLAITPNGREVIFGADERGLNRWCLEDDTVLAIGKQPIANISAIALFDAGAKAVTGCHRLSDVSMIFSPIVVWDLTADKILNTWDIEGGVMDIAMTPDQKNVITAGDSLEMWNLETGKLEHTFEGHSPWVDGVTITPDGKWLISGGADKTIKVWNLAKRARLSTLYGHHGTVRTVKVLPNGNRLLSGSDDQTVRLWDLRRIPYQAKPRAHNRGINALAITPDGKFVISASDDKTLKLWDVETGQYIRSFEGHQSEIWSVAITPNSTRVISLENGAQTIVWDFQTGSIFHRLSLVPRSYNSASRIVLSPNAKYFFYGDEMFEVDTGKVYYTLPEHETAGLAFLFDKKTIVFIGNGTPLRLWDLEAHKETGAFSHGAGAIALLPNDRLISVGYDAVVRLWDINHRALIGELKGHRGRIDDVAVDAKGHYAASASGDHDLKIWDIQRMCEVTAFSAEAPLLSCALALDGHIAIAGDMLGNLHFLKLENLE